MPYQLNATRLREAAHQHGDSNDNAIRLRAGLSKGTFSRLIHGQVEPGIRYLDAFSSIYGVPINELYQEGAEPEAAVNVA